MRIISPQVRGCVHVILGLEASLAPASLGSNLVEEVASFSLCSELEYARWRVHIYNSHVIISILSSGLGRVLLWWTGTR